MILNSDLEIKASDVCISSITIGCVVRKVDDVILPEDFGHVVGFSRNTSNEIIIQVKWSRTPDKIDEIHPSNIVILL